MIVLWKRLTKTDFDAMHGDASPHGRGGGAMHIALGRDRANFPVESFFGARGQSSVTIATASLAGSYPVGTLRLQGNPSRRNGEWTVRDQYSNRHPAWSENAGFPAEYDPDNPPYIFLFRGSENFKIRFATFRDLRRLKDADRPDGLFAMPKGIEPAPDSFLKHLRVDSESLVNALDDLQRVQQLERFNPSSISDGRTRILAAIVQRLGQQQFRKKLISAYAGQCAVTRCNVLWVLEAAHITPYLGIKTNAVSNGLLLRADVHTLFDLSLITIDPARQRIQVSSRLANTEYISLNGVRPHLPNSPTFHPSERALERHFRLFQQ